MRSVAAGLLGIGGIFMAFGATVLIISLLAKVNSHPDVPQMVTLGAASLVGGAVLMVLGYLAGRIGRRSEATPT